ncbi:MAG TPA: signal recognition particle protein, partial [Longimicrobium sp.]|nr:signal recognition particle protein [Longimicrobium sp.]
YRPAAREQLKVVAQAVKAQIYEGEVGEANSPAQRTQAVERLVKEARREAINSGCDVLIVDTAGRLHIDDELMNEMQSLKKLLNPSEILFVADAMTGQDAVRSADEFHKKLSLTGIILTKMDGDARGGAALSIYGVTHKPIKFLGVGEKLDGLEEFHPERMAGRILQQGDVVALVEKAQQNFDQDEAAKLERKVMGAGRFDLGDFLIALRQFQNLGPLENLLKLLPGVNNKMLKNVKIDPQRFKHVEAIILSMTPQERRRPEMLNGPRRVRISRGCGRPVSEINQLLQQFKDMQKFMKTMKGMQGMMPRGGGMPKLPFGGMPRM